MSTESPPGPDLAQLIQALQRLDADRLVGWAAGNDAARDVLRAKIRRVQARATAEAIREFERDQGDQVILMISLLNDWAVMLALVHRLEREIVLETSGLHRPQNRV